MILSTAFRQSKSFAKRSFIGSSSYSASPLAYFQFDVSSPQDDNSSKALLRYPTSHCQTTRSYHASTTIRPTNILHAPPSSSAPTFVASSTTPASYNATLQTFNLPSNVIDQIKSDLKAVDADGNGKIDSEELKELLKKHNSTFTDDEVVELSELFYASSGASSIPIDRFIAALDAAAFPSSTNNGDVMDSNIAHEMGLQGMKFKTHPLGIGTCASEYMFTKTHGKYTKEELDIKMTHVEPESALDRLALFAVKVTRFGFDQATGWNRGSITTDKVLNRAIFLETVAAIPGMVAAIIRHFRSLRNMARDGGMLNMFLEEANNERMHLLTFIRMKDPGYLFRGAVVGSQFAFGSAFLVLYMISPAFCHRFVGYIEEEACATYTKIIKAIEEAPEGSDLAKWRTEEAPKIAKGYWHLGEEGTVLDVMRAVRADEAEHRDVNHAVSGVAHDTVNPLYDPREKMDSMMKRYVKDMMERSETKTATS
mmetsp:Transcript_3692/g.8170  ORF Transcript_3692/g.8170 Transcript_3692/m.8170 type:complete len:482 (+) Transcript_3692:122-1567(+)